MKELKGRIAVVTGGASGIGEGMALAFAEAGMKIAVADIQLDRAEAVAARIRDLGQEAMAAHVDVTSFDSVTALADAAYDAFGAVHLLCNNAGVMVSGPMLNMSVDDWRWSFDVNVFGVVHGIHAFAPRMIAQGGQGHIVNTASMAAFMNGADHSAYTASKHACGAITEALRAELAPHGIGVSGLYPGGVYSDIGTSQRNRGAAYGAPLDYEFGKNLTEAERARLFSGHLQPIEVGRIVRQAVMDDEPWIFTHPTWMADFGTDARALDIIRARDAALARQG